MRFYTDTAELVFADPAQYPAGRPVELMQVRDRTAGGTSHVETYSTPMRTRSLNFQLMPESDYLGILDWFVNVALGMANTFNFEDERGDVFLVRFNNRKLDLKETKFNRFAGTVELEIV